jgi:epsilon-lactone hydrolase
MAIHQYVVLSRAVSGREEEFDKWYDGKHLGDAVRVPGITSARRYRVIRQAGTDVPAWYSLAIYDIDSDDPDRVIAAIGKAARTEDMPISDAFTRDGLLKLLVEPMGSAAGE